MYVCMYVIGSVISYVVKLCEYTTQFCVHVCLWVCAWEGPGGLVRSEFTALMACGNKASDSVSRIMTAVEALTWPQQLEQCVVGVVRILLDCVLFSRPSQCHNAEQLYVWLLHFIANNYLIFSHKADFLELSGQRQYSLASLSLTPGTTSQPAPSLPPAVQLETSNFVQRD